MDQEVAPNLENRGTGFSGRSGASKSRRQGHQNIKRPINYGPATDWEIPEVARAATAAELFFPSVKKKEGDASVKYSDGGFSDANNPTMVGIEDIRERWGSHTVGTVVSVGTSRAPQSSPSTHWRFPGRVKNWTDRMTDPEPVHLRVLGESGKRDTGFPYFRFNADGDHALKIDLDEWKPRGSIGRSPAILGAETRRTIEEQFNRWVGTQEAQDDLTQCAERLVGDRRRRMDRTEWERFATFVEYPCRIEGCTATPDVFHNVNEFHRHFVKWHPSAAGGRKFSAEVRRRRKMWEYPPPPN